jgi:SAM-dependent methyltransferase
MAGFKDVLEALRPRHYADYLFHRFANPSFLGAIPALIVLGDACRRGPRRRLLSLMSGIGLSSSTIGALCPDVQVIMADIDFVNLYIACRFLGPHHIALCIDVEVPLPFCDKSIDYLYCLDGFHYVRSKVALLKEVDRIVSPEGAWLFAHMHNAKRVNINPGVPLDPQGYLQRFAFGQRRLLPESELLRQFQDDGSLDLTHQPSIDVLDSCDALTLAGARNEFLWKRHAELDAALSRRPDLLRFNPLYCLEESADGLLASAAWPSDLLRQECCGTVPLLCESARFGAQVLREIDAARAGEGLSDEVRGLLRSFVLVPLPECYPRTNVAAH